MEKINLNEYLAANEYPGRGIAVAKAPDGRQVFIGYFIMGRSENSRNRVFDPVPERGDIVTFWDEELNKVLVKRVVGLPGETLSFKNGYTYVSGEKLDESYLPTQGITTLPDSMAEKTFTVPEGCMFVMGDNRTGSNDSRLLGEPYIPIEAVQARMLVAISVGSDQSWQGIRWIG